MKKGRIGAASLGDLTGRYRYTRGTDTLVATVSVDGGGLRIQLPGQPSEELVPESASAFFTPVGLRASFTRESGRPASELVLHVGETVRLRRIE